MNFKTREILIEHPQKIKLPDGKIKPIEVKLIFHRTKNGVKISIASEVLFLLASSRIYEESARNLMNIEVTNEMDLHSLNSFVNFIENSIKNLKLNSLYDKDPAAAFTKMLTIISQEKEKYYPRFNQAA